MIFIFVSEFEKLLVAVKSKMAALFWGKFVIRHFEINCLVFGN